MAAKKTITVQQIASANRRPAIQTKTLRGLGLDKLHRTRTLEDTPAVRGMINSIPHLVRIVDDTPASEEGLKELGSDAAQRDQRQARLQERCACVSAAASAPASASRAAAAARARRPATGVAIGGFEGGQMPLHRRLPKRGFNKWRRKDFNEINVGALQQAIDDKRLDAGKPVDVDALVAAGIVRRAKDGLRLLGSGEIKAKLTLTVNHASARPRRRSRRPAARSS